MLIPRIQYPQLADAFFKQNTLFESVNDLSNDYLT